MRFERLGFQAMLQRGAIVLLARSRYPLRRPHSVRRHTSARSGSLRPRPAYSSRASPASRRRTSRPARARSAPCSPGATPRTRALRALRPPDWPPTPRGRTSRWSPWNTPGRASASDFLICSTIFACSSLPSDSVGITSVSCVHQWPMPILAYSRITSSKLIGCARRRVEQRLPLICARPLRPGDVVLSARGGRIGASARCHQPLDESALLIRRYGFHR